MEDHLHGCLTSCSQHSTMIDIWCLCLATGVPVRCRKGGSWRRDGLIAPREMEERIVMGGREGRVVKGRDGRSWYEDDGYLIGGGGHGAGWDRRRGS